MQSFPHHYQVTATGHAAGILAVSSPGLPGIEAAPPAEFDGPGDAWSPETLMMSAVASCFVLSFRAVAAASKFDWVSISCRSEGTLDRVERVTRFTEVINHIALVVPAGTDQERAQKMLEKSESVCLVSNSLSATVHLVAEIVEG
ncbi:MAG: OsmC family protein [Pseudomonadota bacterium]